MSASFLFSFSPSVVTNSNTILLIVIPLAVICFIHVICLACQVQFKIN